MEGVIFIRSLSSEQETILEQFKSEKLVSVNTKAVQGIISEYGRLVKNEDRLYKKINYLENEITNLKREKSLYDDFFQILNKIQLMNSAVEKNKF